MDVEKHRTPLIIDDDDQNPDDEAGFVDSCIKKEMFASMDGSLKRSLLLVPPESCDGCGLCCEGIGSPVLLYASRAGLPAPHPFRPAELPQNLIEEIDNHFSGLTRGQESQDRCLWFDPVTRACRHYEFRPQICRDYDLGGRACLQRRRDELKT